MKIFADTHIHSCLSPCADEEMTPNNIVNMALIKGLNLIAVTDHNSADNLRAVTAAAEGTGLCIIPGMELESSEEVHILAYFDALEKAEALSKAIYKFLPDTPNNPRFFGSQRVMDKEDNFLREEQKLLVQPLELSIDEIVPMIRDFGGEAVPAHIDRPSHGIIPLLGFISPYLNINTVEISAAGIASDFREYPCDLLTLTASDAHDLGSIFEAVHQIQLTQNSPQAFLEAIIKGKYAFRENIGS